MTKNAVKKWATKKNLLIIAAIVVVLCIVFSARNRATQMRPVNGKYSISDSKVICTLSFPPTCTGDLKLKTSQGEVLVAKVDQATKMQRASDNSVVYGDALQPGSHVTVTFKPKDSVIDTIVITD